ncbi:uncharacterized protein [Cicer arietinum]|uniref:Probable serine/threonine-protein kinase nek3 n=2 Tax=Cicer arietinum TaxID=3827 RepID=A0A1S2XVX6_CICAR|nr:probable serine/threonine-protein kinase nek3 [Cicer arietinum]
MYTCLTMSRTFSSKKASYLHPPPTPTTTVAKSCSNKRRSPQSPLQDFNRISNSSNSSDASSSVSAEVPKGCLRFLASSSFKTPVNRPKNINKTPNSAPHGLVLKQSKSNSSKENLPKGGNNAGVQTKTLVPNKAKNPPCLYQWQSGKKSGSKIGQKSKLSSPLNEHGKHLPAFPLTTSEELKQKEDVLGGINDNAVESANHKSSHKDVKSTPLSKKALGPHLDVMVFREAEDNPNRSISKTPPIHNSLSPEIQGGSSLVSTATTPACYGAGYIVSGVTDKRKCRPRGILTVEENYSSSAKMVTNSIDDDADEKKTKDVIKKDSPSMLPLPTEALVHWISSPRNKGEKIGLNQSQALRESTTRGSCTSPSSSSKSFWNICDSSKTFWNGSDSSDLSGATNGMRSKMSSSISPCRLSEFQIPFDSILFSPKSSHSCRAGSSENLIDENSPFSLNSIGSGNVIQTPQSDSSSDLHVALSLAHADNQKEDHFNPELNLYNEVLLSENFLLNNSLPLEDSVNSSFQFDCLTVPYESIDDLSKLPKKLDDQDPWLSSSTIETGSPSLMRISWREGLMRQVDELDEFDCCRCLSDEEDLANDNDCGSNSVSGTQVNIEVDEGEKPNYDVRLTETEDKELEIDGIGKEMFSGAELVSTNEGSLVASKDDSDWNLCYLN